MITRKIHMVCLVMLGIFLATGVSFYAAAKGKGKAKKKKKPVEMHMLQQPKWTSIEAGVNHVCATGDDGSVWCWGQNSYGQLGNILATFSSYTFPIQVTLGNQVISIAGGWHHTCVAAKSKKSKTNVFCWGRCQDARCSLDKKSKPGAAFWKLYDKLKKKKDTFSQYLVKNVIALNPFMAAGSDDAGSVSVGEQHTCVLKKDGTVWCWGRNNEGQLGIGFFTQKAESGGIRSSFNATQVEDITDVTALSAGFFHTCALRSDGTAWCWGRNKQGEVGSGTAKKYSKPMQVQGLADVISISAGLEYTCAITKDGSAWCWGLNDNGQLGDGTKNDSPKPVQVSGLSDVTAISTSIGYFGSRTHTCAVKKDKTAWCWGANKFGQLGDAGADSSAKPVKVPGVQDVDSIAVGYGFTCALKTDANIWCWGNNGMGQLGVGKTTKPLPPTALYKPPEDQE